MAGRFDELFGGLWIHEHPTKLKNAFQMIYFDFSRIGGGDETALKESFNRYCGQVLDAFADKYASFYNEEFVRTLKAEPDAGGKLNYIGLQAELRGYPLYLIIDEYDNFTNVILSDGGKEMFRKLTHASGFYRYYFKIFKAMFSRVFLIGVSPVTLDDLSSGYNIDWNISQDPRFNDMLGFSETDVRDMFAYYQRHGKLRADADIEAMMEEMKPWYNNYCFSQECLSDDRLYNCDMVFYYLQEHPHGLQEAGDAGRHRPGQPERETHERHRGDRSHGIGAHDPEHLLPRRIRDGRQQFPKPAVLLRTADHGQPGMGRDQNGDPQQLREGAILEFHA